MDDKKDLTRTTVQGVEVLSLLFRRFEVGERVRATLTIIDASHAVEVPEGTEGTVRAIKAYGCDPLVAVDFWGVAERLVVCVDALESIEGAS